MGSILTQLIFDHALRIRMKAETLKSSPKRKTDDKTPRPSDISSSSQSLLEGESSQGDSTTLAEDDNTTPDVIQAQELVGYIVDMRHWNVYIFCVIEYRR